MDVTTRLIELIDKQPRNWQQSASVLARCGDPERAREYLSKLYAEAETEADQKQIVSWLNEIRGENGLTQRKVRREPMVARPMRWPTSGAE